MLKSKCKAERKEAELLETVVKPAEAARQKQQLQAEGRKFEQVKAAEVEGEKLRLEEEARASVIEAMGLAEAGAIRVKGLAEAKALENKAEAFAKMEEAGKLQMVIEKLPEIDRAVDEPLYRIDKITIIGGGGDSYGVYEVVRYTVGVLKAVTEALKETIGFDLMNVMKANTFDTKTTKNINLDVKGLPEGKTIPPEEYSVAIGKSIDILNSDASDIN